MPERKSVALRDGGQKDGGVQVIARAAAILRALGPQGASLGALAKATGLPRSTVQRIVDALATEDLVETGDGGVRIGWGVQHLAQAGQSAIAARVRPHLFALFERTRETVDISTIQGRQVAFLDRVVSDQELRVVPINGRPRPLYAMANGKALLSCLPDAQLASALQSLEPLTPQTITSADDLRAQLARVHTEGFAYDYEEHAPGVCALGTPIMAPGLPPHAISVVTPASRFAERLPVLRAALAEARAAMEAELAMPAPLR